MLAPLQAHLLQLAPGAGAKARKRELVIREHLNEASMTERQQRGVGFYVPLFDDLCKDAAAYAQDKAQAKRVIVYTSLWAGSGEDREALAEWIVQRLKRPSGPAIYGLFWEKQEGRWLVTKARGEMKVAELYQRQEIASSRVLLQRRSPSLPRSCVKNAARTWWSQVTW